MGRRSYGICILSRYVFRDALTSSHFNELTIILPPFTSSPALCLGYHVMAFIGVAVLGESSSEWPRLMNQPWRSTSLLEFWGKRWHQVDIERAFHLRVKPRADDHVVASLGFRIDRSSE